MNIKFKIKVFLGSSATLLNPVFTKIAEANNFINETFNLKEGLDFDLIPLNSDAEVAFYEKYFFWDNDDKEFVLSNSHETTQKPEYTLFWSLSKQIDDEIIELTKKGKLACKKYYNDNYN